VALGTNALERAPAALATRRRLAVSAGALELLLVGGLAVLAVLVRWPELFNVPRFTDETDDTLYSLAIYRGQILPLTNFTTYNSALFNYLQAGAFHLLGLRAEVPRLVVFALGVLTVPACYGLGRALGGPLAGALAALLLGANALHSSVNSHVGWSNCTTPLFTTLAFWALHLALRPAPDPPPLTPSATRDRPLLLAAFGLGLALQTHWTVALLLPGAALALLIQQPRLLRGRRPWLAAAAFLLGYLPMVLFNLQTGLGSLEESVDKQRLYVDQRATTLPVFLDRLGDELLALPAMVGGAPIDDEDRLRARPADPRVWLGAAVTLLALGGQARRRSWLPLLLCLSLLLGLPLLIDRYERIVDSRYLAPLPPLIFAALAAELVASARASSFGRPLWRRAGLAAVALLLVGLQLAALAGYYRSVRSTNLAINDALRAIQATIRPDEQVVVDSELAEAVSTGDGRLERIFRAVLGSAGLRYVVADVSRDWLSGQLRQGETDLLIAPPSRARALGADFELTQLARASQVARSTKFDFATYRVTALREPSNDGRPLPAGDKLERMRAEKSRLNASEAARSRIPE
jgi:4-amino-4-deoxy-L-arabinose transferase-like glycosyltransferase